MINNKRKVNKTIINITNYNKDSIKVLEKNELLKYISNNVNKSLTCIKSIFLDFSKIT